MQIICDKKKLLIRLYILQSRLAAMNAKKITVLLVLCIAQQSYCRPDCTSTGAIICPKPACVHGK